MAIHIQSFTIPHFPSLMIAMSKPAYLAIREHSPTKPIIIFVSSRRQCRLTVDDLLTHCSADDKPDLFLNIELIDLQPHLDHINDKGLVETLKHGIGYYHEALDIIEVTQHIEGLTYRPRTVETREVYQLILSSVHTALGDQAQDIVHSAADAVLETLKNDNLKDFDKKKEIEEVIGNISNEQLSQLITLSTDYNAEDEDTINPDLERKEAEIDEQGGIAAVFDKEDWDDDGVE
jgi:hypothetical protein